MSWHIFGRQPLPEDLVNLGWWAYAATWLTDSEYDGRIYYRERMLEALPAAVKAAALGGRGGPERMALISAISKLEAGFQGTGPLAPAAKDAEQIGGATLHAEGHALRINTKREAATYLPRLDLRLFDHAIQHLSADRNVMFREVYQYLVEGLREVKVSCPALNLLRLFLANVLKSDTNDAYKIAESGSGGGTHPIPMLSLWLSADIALNARRGTAYNAAWSTAARTSGDAISRTISGLANGTMASSGVAAALIEDPWALIVALSMITAPEHSQALIDVGVAAQTTCRSKVEGEVRRWKQMAARVGEIERGLEVKILVSLEARTGHQQVPDLAHLDLFSLWAISMNASDALRTLQLAIDQTLEQEGVRRQALVDEAEMNLKRLEDTQSNALEKARRAHDGRLLAGRKRFEQKVGDGQGAQRGCVFGLASGVLVIVMYVMLCVFVGTQGTVGKMGPLVIAVSAIPVATGIFAYLAYMTRRAAAQAEQNRQIANSEAKYVRAKELVTQDLGLEMSEWRERLLEANQLVTQYEKALAEETRQALRPKKSKKAA